MRTIRNRARHAVTAAVVVTVLLPAAACGTDPVPTWRTPTSSAKAPVPESTTTTAPARLAKITSACKLLPAAVAVKILGGNQKTRLNAKEHPVENEDGTKKFTCEYHREGVSLLALTTGEYAGQANDTTATIDHIAEGNVATASRIQGLGADAVTYMAAEDIRALAVVVPYHKNMRLVVLAGAKLIPQAKFEELARHVLAQT